ncbi:MAG: DUF4837 family protein [Bacteroidaceae bacterium]|nr:DUF4837 family protein [Bacteroidaceae bacterium]
MRVTATLSTLLVSFLIMLQACSSGVHSSLPSSNGRPYHVLVVVPDGQQHSLLALTLRKLLTQTEKSLPQPEPMFAVTTITESAFSEAFRKYRNIVLVNVSPDEFTATKLHVATDVASAPQLVVELQSPSMEDCHQYVADNSPKLLNLLLRSELSVATRAMNSEGTNRFASMLRSRFSVAMRLPKEIDAVRDDKAALWLSSNRLNTMNICVYSYPYYSERVFCTDSFLVRRQNALSQAIRGYHDGSRMSVVNGSVHGRNTSLQGRYAYRVSGLWQMEGEPMGGPFVSYSTVDTLRNRVIVVEGFVFAPDREKLPLVRRLEASVGTLRIIENSEKTI